MSRATRTLMAFAFMSAALATLAQVPPGGAWFSGPVQAVSGNTVALQGLTLTAAEGAKLFTVQADGAFAEIALDQVIPGDSLHGRFVLRSGVPTLLRGYVGNHFFWHGTVTAVNADGEGNLLSVELDHLATVHASQARIVGVPPGQEQSSDQTLVGDPNMEEVQADLVQVGSTVGVNGIVTDGVFAATWINVSAITFAFSGGITSVTLGEDQHVVGFDLARGSKRFGVALDRRSLVWRGKKQVNPDLLAVGTKVKADGWVLADGSVLAKNVWILR